MHSDELAEIDGDDALPEALDTLGLTRSQLFRRGAVGAAGAAAGATLLTEASPAFAKSKKTDITVLQAALVFEHLGATLYGLASSSGKLSGKTQLFAETVYGHEVTHVNVVSAAIRGLGGTPKAPPTFHFGSIPSDPKRLRSTAAAVEQLCVEVINGAGPLVTRPTLAAAGQLVSVEARHVSWIRQIIGITPAASSFDTTTTAAKATAIAKSKGFIH